MRRQRAILFDDDPDVLGLLAEFFEERGYDVLAFQDSLVCAAHHSDPAFCGDRPCADLLIADMEMPCGGGLRLLEAQARHGCSLSPLNKAVLSGNLDPAAREAIGTLGSAWFTKPLRFLHLEEWVRECEARMDLSRPPGALRRERREPCRLTCQITLGPADEEWPGEILNKSFSGLCLRTDRQLALGQQFAVRTSPAALPERLAVRWTTPDHAGGFLAGAVRS